MWSKRWSLLVLLGTDAWTALSISVKTASSWFTTSTCLFSASLSILASYSGAAATGKVTLDQKNPLRLGMAAVTRAAPWSSAVTAVALTSSSVRVSKERGSCTAPGRPRHRRRVQPAGGQCRGRAAQHGHGGVCAFPRAAAEGGWSLEHLRSAAAPIFERCYGDGSGCPGFEGLWIGIKLGFEDREGPRVAAHAHASRYRGARVSTARLGMGRCRTGGFGCTGEGDRAPATARRRMGGTGRPRE